MFTEKEKQVIEAIMEESNFNCDSIDINKSWAENSETFENDCSFLAIADSDYSCGMTVPQMRAIFGSLSKKGCISIQEDESNGRQFNWIVIYEDNFANIKKEMGL